MEVEDDVHGGGGEEELGAQQRYLQKHVKRVQHVVVQKGGDEQDE